MRLAIDTASAACSVALFDGERLVAERHELIGRGHAERLMPMLAELLASVPDVVVRTILVDVGPGSFTGLRVGIAAARGLALAWRADIAGYAATAVIAAAAFATDPGLARIAVAIDAARGQVYVQCFDRTAGAQGDVQALTPAEAAQLLAGWPLAGTGAVLVQAHGDFSDLRLPEPVAASAARLLDPSSLDQAVRPLYVRPPDARLPATA